MKHNFKLLIITPTHLPAYHIGGPVFQINKMSNYLDSKKVNYQILSTRNSFSKGGKRAKNTIYLNSYLGKLYFSFELILFLFNKIKRYDKIYIVSCFNFFSLFSALICSFFKKDYFLSPRGSLMKKSVDFKNKLIKKIWIFLFEKISVNNAKKIIFSSNFEETETKKIIGFKNSKIINNFFTIKPDKNKRRSSNNLLFLGRITKKKNIENLIYAFKNEFNFKIKIVGSGKKKYINFLKKIVNEKKLKNKIHILPATYNEKVKRTLFKEARFSILLSVTENFGNTILESLLCRTPVIVSKNTGLSNFIKRKKVGIICEDKISNLSNLYKKIDNGFNIKISKKTHGEILNIFDNKKIMKKYFKLFDIK